MSLIELGLTLSVPDPDAPEPAVDAIADQAEAAETLGAHSVWLPESHFQPGGGIPAPLLLLAAAAARTRRVRLATTSYLLTLRNPLLVAEEVAVLDRLSGGRVILGVGRGFRPELFDAFEVPRAEKRDRFEAALESMTRAWSGAPIPAVPPEEGRDPEPITLSPLPIQKPHPPVWVAAFGPKALAQAGRLGLPYLASPVEPIGRLIENHRLHRETWPDSVAQGSLAVPVMRTVFVTRDGPLADRVRETLLKQARGMRRRAAAILRELDLGRIDDWALIGDPDQVRAGVERYRESVGMTHLIARTGLPGVSAQETRISVELLAELLAVSPR